MTSAWVAGLPLIAGAVVLARVVTRRGRSGIYILAGIGALLMIGAVVLLVAALTAGPAAAAGTPPRPAQGRGERRRARGLFEHGRLDRRGHRGRRVDHRRGHRRGLHRRRGPGGHERTAGTVRPAMVIVGLAEGIAIYGLIIGIILIGKA